MNCSPLFRLLVRATAWTFVLALSTPATGATLTVTRILGQPTDRSISVATRANASLELFVQYGTAPGAYSAQTTPAVTTADPNASGFFVARIVISGLQPDTRYWYRVQARAAGSSDAFTADAESTFHTQRLPGSTFVFCAQGDSHPEREKSMFSPALYTQTLKAVAAEQPDFYFLSGDDFSVDTLKTPYTQASVSGRYTLQLPYLDVLARSTPLFLVNGNHEQASLYNYGLAPDADNTPMVPVWAQNARNLYFPSPAPDDPDTGTFYSGNATPLAGIGLLRDYYAWQHGDALFVVIDPYWTSPALVDNGIGGNGGGGGKTPDRWLISHGDAQYQWLKRILEQSTAKWKFVFAHHVMGTGRGGIDIANQWEWGGESADGSWGFPAKRPTWSLPIHQLMAANKVTIFFQGHDHLFAREELDGVVYQSLPNPADWSYTAYNADAYPKGNVFPNSGYVKVTVGPSAVKVDYVREFLPQDETDTQKSGQVAFSYTVAGSAPPTPTAAATWLLPSSAHWPGAAGSYWTTDLAIANTGATDAVVTVKFLGNNQDGRGGIEKSASLGAGKSATYSDILQSLFVLPSTWGAIQVRSDSASLAVSSQTSTPAVPPATGTFGQSVPGFADSELIRGAATRSILSIRDDTSFRTNLILANATEAPIVVDLALVAEDGTRLASKQAPLLPLGMTQFTGVVREMGVTTDVLGARLVLSTPSGATAAFAAYAVLIDNRTNDPRTLLPR